MNKKKLKFFVGFAALLGAAGLLLVFMINWYMISRTKRNILDISEMDEDVADCILILGCGVREDGTPSGMLEDRLLTGIRLYEQGAAKKLIVSGDHGRKDYDEVNLMKQYAMERGVPSEDIFMDHAGFSTYESMYRARDIFQVRKMIVVTQRYHLYRALYTADAMGMEAWGVSADLRSYGGQKIRDARELLARAKDFLYCIGKPEPTYLGEAIPVNGDGNLTNDK